LPDGLFSSTKLPIWENFGEPGRWKVLLYVFYGHLEYFTASRNNLWQFGIVCGHLVYFSRFGMFVPRKIWQA
jgi:hypothetical protein